jgi:hypothetical protein
LVLEQPVPGEVASLILDSHGVTGAQAKVVALVLWGYSTKQIVSQLADLPAVRAARDAVIDTAKPKFAPGYVLEVEAWALADD